MEAAHWALTAAAGVVAGLVSGPFVAILADRVPAGGALLPGRAAGAGPGPAGFADLIPVICRPRAVPRGRAGLELLTAASFTVMALRFGLGPLLPAIWYLTAVGIALIVVDVRQRRLPDRLTLPSYPAAVVLLGGGGLLLPDGAGHLTRALAGLAAAGAFFLLLAFISPNGIGWGDVKLSGLLGFYLGWFGAGALIGGLAAGFTLAALTGLALITAGKATRKSQLPLGAFLLAAALAVLAAAGPYPPLPG